LEAFWAAVSLWGAKMRPVGLLYRVI